MKVEITENNVDEIIAKKNEAIRRGLEACGAQAQAYASLKTPVDTGRLRASTDWYVDGDYVIIGNVQEYAPYVELGTSRTKAQPFLKPAVEGRGKEYQAIIENELRDG